MGTSIPKSPTRSLRSTSSQGLVQENSCGICVAFCPRQCLGLAENGAPVVKDSKRCNGCRWCEIHCPDFAILVKEVATAGEKKAEEAD